MKFFLIMSLLMLGESAPETEKDERIKISSQRATHDMGKNISILTGKVKVIDGEMTITCDRMTIENDDQNGAKFVLAEKNVVIVKEGKIAFGERAEYYVLDERVELTGKPKIVDKDPKTGKENEIRGSKIVLYRDKQIVEILEMKGDLEGGKK